MGFSLKNIHLGVPPWLWKPPHVSFRISTMFAGVRVAPKKCCAGKISGGSERQGTANDQDPAWILIPESGNCSGDAPPIPFWMPLTCSSTSTSMLMPWRVLSVNHVYPLVNWHSYWKWPFSWLTHWKWWSSIAMLMYQGVKYGGFLKYGYPQIIHLNRIFHYQTYILGYQHLWKQNHRFYLSLMLSRPFTLAFLGSGL